MEDKRPLLLRLFLGDRHRRYRRYEGDRRFEGDRRRYEEEMMD